MNQEGKSIWISAPVVWTLIVTAVGLTVFYFKNQSAFAEKLTTVKTEISTELVASIKSDADIRAIDLQRIATLEEAMKTLKENTTETRNDVKNLSGDVKSLGSDVRSLLQYVGVKK